MEQAWAINKIERNLSKEKIDNAVYTEEVDYWKKVALEGKGCAENIHEMIFYLKKLFN